MTVAAVPIDAQVHVKLTARLLVTIDVIVDRAGADLLACQCQCAADLFGAVSALKPYDDLVLQTSRDHMPPRLFGLLTLKGLGLSLLGAIALLSRIPLEFFADGPLAEADHSRDLLLGLFIFNQTVDDLTVFPAEVTDCCWHCLSWSTQR